MRNTGNKAVLLGIIIVAGLFLAAMYELLLLRYETGNTYPVYSSMRTDPLGTRALHDAYAAIPGLRVSRNLLPINSLEDSASTAIIMAGALPTKDPEDLLESLERMVSSGNRLLITFAPLYSEYRFDRYTGKDDEEEEAASDDAPADEEPFTITPVDDTFPEEEESARERELREQEERLLGRIGSIQDRWGFRYLFERIPRDDDGDYEVWEAALVSEVPGLPEVMSWHTGLGFDELDEAWTTLYLREDTPVVVERAWGDGTIVLASDTFFVSNEAMRSERHTGLLAWLVGPQDAVIFDETHLGIGESPGVMTLARRYRLHGVIAALAMVTLLFVWRNMLTLVPRQATSQRDPFAGRRVYPGQTLAAGFLNLLRRSVPLPRLLEICHEEWVKSEKAFGTRHRNEDEDIQRVMELNRAASPKHRDSAGDYRRISAILAKKKGTL